MLFDAFERDITLLLSFGHIEYSLLLLPLLPSDKCAIAALSAQSKGAPPLLMDRVFRATAVLTSGEAVASLLCLTIIDYLAPFNAKKAASMLFKRSCFRPDLALKAIDTVPPAFYSSRFETLARGLFLRQLAS